MLMLTYSIVSIHSAHKETADITHGVNLKEQTSSVYKIKSELNAKLFFNFNIDFQHLHRLNLK